MDICEVLSVVSVYILVMGKTTAVDLSDCVHALGMESGKIPDSALSASTSLDWESVGPQSARIRTEFRGGAWCPKNPVTNNTYEYLQIDLPSLHVITLVEVQGRFGNGQGQEFTEYFKLDYQRGRPSGTEEGKWIRYHNRIGTEVIKGNENTYIAELRKLDPPIVADRIRFVPYAIFGDPRTVCMRVEIYGCISPDGLLSYSMPQGDDEYGPNAVALYDRIFDGTRVVDCTEFGDCLSRGIGQLYDGVITADGTAGFWVGWRKDTERPSYVKIIFEFDVVRVFEEMSFHCSNDFLVDVLVFRRADTYFRIHDNDGWGYVVSYSHVRDMFFNEPRTVTIPLYGRVGRYVLVELYFDDYWMLINEVSFTTRVANSSDIPIATTTTSTTEAVTAPAQERQDISCGADAITAFVPASLLPANTDVTWSDPSCHVQSNGTHYVASIALHDCGTTVHFTDDTVIFENALTSQGSTQTISPVVDFGESAPYTIPVRCVYPRRQNVSSTFFPVRQQARVFEKRYGHLDLRMDHFSDASFSQLQTSQQTPLGGDIYIKLTVDHLNRSDLALKADNCVATPSASPADSTFFRLMQNGCPASSTVQLYQSPFNEVRFRMKSFMFRSAGSSLVYIHCEVSVCPAHSTECNVGCTSRRKRDVSESGSSHLLSTGPILLVADKGFQASTIAAAVCAAVAVVATVFAVIGWRRRSSMKSEHSVVQ